MLTAYTYNTNIQTKVAAVTNIHDHAGRTGQQGISRPRRLPTSNEATSGLINKRKGANLACFEVFPDVMQVNQPILPFVNSNIRRYKHSEKAYAVSN